MHNTPSTQRTPGPSDPSSLAHGGEARSSAPMRSLAGHDSPADELDGLHDGEEQRIASWLHLSLGLETG